MAEQPSVVLVTGAPRSGTTPVGELLAAAPGAIELYEPMSPVVGDRAVRRWFELPGQDGFDVADADAFVERLKRRRLAPSYRPAAVLGRRARSRWLNRTRRSAMLARWQPWRGPMVWKDPMAFFLAPRLARSGRIPVVVTLRDPLSVAASFKRMGWALPPGDVARRAAAAYPLCAQAVETAIAARTPAQCGAALWFVLHAALLHEMEAGLPALLLPSSLLLSDPVGVRERLVRHTGLRLPTASAHREVLGLDLNTSLPDRAHVAERSLASVTDYWRRILTTEEVAACRTLNEALWERLQAELPV